jgi:ribosomal protein L21E
MPIHPDYAKVLKPSINMGDLVETYNGKMGIVVGVDKPKGYFLQIKEANNNYYTVLINDIEKKYVGYSLKKIKK